MAYIKRKKAYGSRRKVCEFCEQKVGYVDYKNLDVLKKYVTVTGQIKGKSSTGACAKHQRKVSTAVKRARIVALMPFSVVRVRVNK
ncbi:30S ribosomal protein S18 [Mycoplasma corogypsi]|uniref:30S ribosomal protein S18 n=1 Tax=Mycoplasma corogypsi TaxID=2106 RepID=UPI003872D1F8